MFTVIKVFLSLLIVIFIVRYLKNNFVNFNPESLKFNWLNLTISTLLVSIFFYNQYLLWYLITKINKCNLQLQNTIRLRALSEIGKYLPGKVFGYAILMYNYSINGHSKSKLLICFTIELLGNILAIMLIFFTSIIFEDQINDRNRIFIVLAFFIISIVIIHPKTINFVIDIFNKYFKRSTEYIEVSFFLLFCIVILYMINFYIFGFAFIFLINSISYVSFTNILFITSSTTIAGLIGLISIFVPAGLGVREGMLLISLNGILGPVLSASIALVSRLWMTIAELLIIGIVYIPKIQKGINREIKDVILRIRKE